MILLSQILNVSELSKDLGPNPKITKTGVTHDTLMDKIRAELAGLKVIIDTEFLIFYDSSAQDQMPRYKGVNRYYFVKSLLKSMAKKYECVAGFLATATNETPEKVKEKIIECKFAVADNIRVDANINLNWLRMLSKAFYDKDGAIFRVLKLFDEYEAAASNQPLTDDSHPLSKFIVEDQYDNRGDPLSNMDKNNADMEIKIPDTVSVVSPSMEENVCDTVSREDNGAVSMQTNQEMDHHSPMPNSREASGSPALPVQEVGHTEVPPAPTPSQPSSTSLRTGGAEGSSQKASSAYDSFVTLLLAVSAVFAL
ncbi:hypothetical protein BBBOND_0205950 [Babesia bigemina]|uniref:Uncharacterized protein n=1 Tax=Babesia bigemina TaxID=5866 RepID=A0A061D5Z3_BABBI|nr:hypothetical protein BBBOND_0205950 [Babesia bigemina]CDR95437.1 hypothetical protein BBBOND_0205950 [Babesia bigemina]|eukprot:XP_012767623.1 hypothetical protein BBBOND_0205950 [Babesia bigemina]